MIIVMKAGAVQKGQGRGAEADQGAGVQAPMSSTAPPATSSARSATSGASWGSQTIESMHGVESVVPILQPYKLASAEVKKERSIIRISDSVAIGGPEIIVMAGPCSVESEEQIIESAQAVKAAGAHVLRGGAFKPRTSPYSFQGLEEEGLKLLAKARDLTRLPIVTEVINPETVDLVAEYADILQIGARNSQELCPADKRSPDRRRSSSKRGMSHDHQEFLMAPSNGWPRGTRQ